MINQNDIEVGMYFTNDGTVSLPVYDDDTATGDVMLSINPGSNIGQVVQLKYGAGGLVIQFSSDDIHNAMSGLEKAEWFFLKLIPGARAVGNVKFDDLKNVVSDPQMAKQKAGIQTAKDNGVNIANTIKKIVKKGEDIAAAAIPWKTILIAAGIYLVATNKDVQKDLFGSGKSSKKSQKLLN